MQGQENIGMFADLTYDDSFVRTLPGDEEIGPRVREVRNSCFSEVSPTPMPAPRLLAVAKAVANLLNLDSQAISREELAKICGGQLLVPGMRPYAACYGGHQFGNWAGQLGDGRAITLGEVLTGPGARQELQLKGAGKTPYSRTADGRAVLRSSIREFLCSEAMHSLGVPTTRALCLIATGEAIWRDILYDGHPRQEPGAVVCRVAPSFVRFGNFELPAARAETDTLKRLCDYVIATHFPACAALGSDAIPAFFEEVCKRTAVLFAQLMRVGFVHGVLNTDNMSILGLCIDYGPFGFLDVFDPDFTPNTTDSAMRRYRYGQQPRVAQWNLARLGSALLSLLPDSGPLEQSLRLYASTYEREAQSVWAHKLGLESFRDEGEGAGDTLLVRELESALTQSRADMPRFYRLLAQLDSAALSAEAPAANTRELLASVVYGDDEASLAPLIRWLARYGERLRADALSPALRRARMDAANPKYVLRNYLAQQAIDAAENGDLTPLHTLQQVLERPYDDQPEHEIFAKKRPDWAELRPGCGMLSCSS